MKVIVDSSILLNGNLLDAEHPLSEIGNIVFSGHPPVPATLADDGL